MPVQSNDIKFHLSTQKGKRGSSSEAETLDAPGGWISKSLVPVRLFGDISGLENEKGYEDCRCVFVANHSQSSRLVGAKVWIERTHPDKPGAEVALAVDNLPASEFTARTQQALVTKDVYSPPTLPYRIATAMESAVLIGDLPPGFARAVWVRRRARNLPAADDDGFILHVQGDTTE